MQLGTLMSHLENHAEAGSALMALGNLTLFARVESMGRIHDELPGEYVANASRRFAARAGDEDWLAVMNAVERSKDPGQAVLTLIVNWALARDEAPEEEAGQGECGGNCGCGGGH